MGGRGLSPARLLQLVFFAQYPEGFYAGLAKGQLNKIAAEAARFAAVEKADRRKTKRTGPLVCDHGRTL
jgi:hypothetical protein